MFKHSITTEFRKVLKKLKNQSLEPKGITHEFQPFIIIRIEILGRYIQNIQFIS